MNTRAVVSRFTIGATAALIGVLATLGPVTAAETVAHTAPSARAANERTALDSIGQARHHAQNRQQAGLIDQIERAERALLNISQLDRDPHVDNALMHLTAARNAVYQNDMRTAETALAQATRELLVSLAAAAPGTTAPQIPAIGAVAYDQGSQEVGHVADIIFDPAGRVMSVVIHTRPAPGMAEKNVAVPAAEVTLAGDRIIVARTGQQLQEAADYPLPDYDTGTLSGTSQPR